MMILAILQTLDLEPTNTLLADLRAQVAFDVIIDSAEKISADGNNGDSADIDLILIVVSTLPSTVVVASPEQDFLGRVLDVRALNKPVYLIELTDVTQPADFDFIEPDHRLQFWRDPQGVKNYLIDRIIDSQRLARSSAPIIELHAPPPEGESDESDWAIFGADNNQSDVIVPSPAPLLPPALPIPFAPPPPAASAPSPIPPYAPPSQPPPGSQPPPIAGRSAPPPAPKPQMTGRDRERTQGSASKPGKPVEAKQAAPTEEVFFTAYYPREIQAMRPYGLYVYAHLSDALGSVAHDVEKFKTELGGLIPAPKSAKKSAKLRAGTPMTITPECDDGAIIFDPPSLTKKWDDDWKRFEFDFKPPVELVGETVTGRIAIMVYGVEVANIRFAFEVNAEQSRESGPRQVVTDILQRVRKENPLASAKYASTPTAAMYHRIFVSYSRKDRPVAESYRLAQMAIGNDVFMDTYSIRTGEQWQAALAKAIDEADIFQLFWSENAASSVNVRDEWEYALHYKCPETDCATFVRPVYWIEPMPVKPPDELAHLNFRYVPMLTVPISVDSVRSESESDSS